MTSEPVKNTAFAAARRPVKLGNWVIEEELGRGAMGTVFRAKHQTLTKVAAVKLIGREYMGNQQMEGRFVTEAQLAERIRCPQVVEVRDFGLEDGQFYLVMELVEGETLAHIVERDGPYPPLKAAELGLEIAKGLQKALEARVIHRDIKPDNILLSRDGQVKIADMGLAKSLDSTGPGGTQIGVGMGTPGYMPPEQFTLAAKADHRADMHALGATLYHLVTGRPPYFGSDVMRQTMNGSREPMPPAAQELLGSIVSRLLRPHAGERYQDYGELIADLSAVVNQPGTLPLGPAPTPVSHPRLIVRPTPIQAPVFVPQRRATFGALGWTCLALGLVCGAAALLVPETRATLATSTTGALTQNIADRIIGKDARVATDRFATIVTDLKLSTRTGAPPLAELSRIYDPTDKNAGELGLGWHLLMPYSLQAGREYEQSSGIVAPKTMHLKNNLNGAETELQFGQDEQHQVRYAGAGIAPWTGLYVQANGGFQLTDGRDNQVQFSADMRVILIAIEATRWVYQYSGERLAAIQSAPSAVVPRSVQADGSFATAEVRAPDATVFELQGEEDGDRVLRPSDSSARWERLLVHSGNKTATLVDRWGSQYMFNPLNNLLILNSSSTPPSTSSGSAIYLTYDAVKRVASAQAGAESVTYHYDGEGKLRGYEGQGNTFEYRSDPGQPPMLYRIERLTELKKYLGVSCAVFGLLVLAQLIRARVRFV